MHGYQGHQTLLAALTAPGKERTNAFGRMGLAFAYNHGKPLQHQSEIGEQSNENVNIANIIRILQRPGVLNVIVKRNAPVVPMQLILSILQLYLVEEFNADVQTGQLIQMMTGVCIMCSNGFGVVWMRKIFSEPTLLLIGMMFFSITFSLFFFFYRLWMIVIIMPFASLGMSFITTVADSLLTALVEEDEQGLVLGVAFSINSFVRTFAPAISGFVVDTLGFSFLALIGSLSTAFGHAVILMFPLQEGLLRKAKTN
ncbi:hypothetical protein ANCCAN_15935 [Ancylostoma caninum]|uniref:Major facilitator superfamily (MFS) profile domain-containing protein n=1 Tax=Ancylostoma caninum TaxID=29170 RepID=A0A368G5A6_ANCCA|nr:hypothetical protein ANCCAN_15935 [Ancylostoma caninum]